MLTSLRKEGIMIAQQLVHRLCLCCLYGMRKKRPWWSAVHHLKRRGVMGRVEGRIVTILYPRKPINPGARSIPDEATKVHGDHLVNNLRLAIR
jgi:hypothetical protein